MKPGNRLCISSGANSYGILYRQMRERNSFLTPLLL